MTYFNLVALALLTTCAAPAHAEVPCHPKTEVIEYLTGDEYQLVFVGTADDHKTALAIYVNDAGWLSVVETPDGKMCLVGSGPDWQLKQTGEPA